MLFRSIVVSMDSIHRTLLAFSSLHVHHDEAFGERYEVILNHIIDNRLSFGAAYFNIVVQYEKLRK